MNARRVLVAAVAAVGMAIVWLVSRWDDQTMYDDMEGEREYDE